LRQQALEVLVVLLVSGIQATATGGVGIGTVAFGALADQENLLLGHVPQPILLSRRRGEFREESRVYRLDPRLCKASKAKHHGYDH